MTPAVRIRTAGPAPARGRSRAPNCACPYGPRRRRGDPSAPASPRYGRGGGRDRTRPSRGRDSSTRCRASAPAARNGAPRRRSCADFCMRAELLDLDRRVADDVESCLCDQTSVSSGATLRSPTSDHRLVARRAGLRTSARHLVEEVQLVREFRVLVGIGNVAAGRHIEIVQLDAARQLGDRRGGNRSVPHQPACRGLSSGSARGWRRRYSPSCRGRACAR